MKLSTTLRHIDDIPNTINASLIKDFYHYLKEIGTSENYQNQNLKQIIGYAKSFGAERTFYDVKRKEEIISFLDTKIKDISADPDRKCITTWNDYLWRIKYFFRWLYNNKLVQNQDNEPSSPPDWTTPPFVSINNKKTKRISPYLETELWEKEDLVNVIKYESHKRNKAILSLLWDLDARPHEVTLLKIKHIRIRENILQPLVHLYSKPLSYNYQIDRLKVHYDLSSLKKSPYYKETVEHLKLDIPDIPKPEDLENESNQLNSEVEDLENNLIPMWVSQTVSKKKQDSGI